MLWESKLVATRAVEADGQAPAAATNGRGGRAAASKGTTLIDEGKVLEYNLPTFSFHSSRLQQRFLLLLFFRWTTTCAHEPRAQRQSSSSAKPSAVRGPHSPRSHPDYHAKRTHRPCRLPTYNYHPRPGRLYPLQQATGHPLSPRHPSNSFPAVGNGGCSPPGSGQSGPRQRRVLSWEDDPGHAVAHNHHEQHDPADRRRRRHVQRR